MTRFTVCHSTPSRTVADLCRLIDVIEHDICQVRERTAAISGDHYDFLLGVFNSELKHRKRDLDHLILTGRIEDVHP